MMTDLIKLNERGVRVYMSSGGARYRARRADWKNRRGRIAKYNRNRSVAYVIWDGTRSFDLVSVDLIEPSGSQP
jgi:hypothetical protein